MTDAEMSALPHPTHDPQPGRPLARKPLGALLLERGLITQARLHEALDECARTGRRIGEILTSRGWIFETELARAVAEQSALPYIDIAATSVDPEAAQLLPRDFAEHFIAVPVRIMSSGAVLVAVADPTDVDPVVLGIAVGREIDLAVGDLSAIRNAWRFCP
jgi:Type II secretion system (T2SS), protein E, N-terminal domain